MRRTLIVVAGAVISLVALVLAFGRVSFSGGLHLTARVRWSELVEDLRAARVGWLVAFTALNIASLLPRAVQLRALARRRDGAPPRLRSAWHASAIGMFAQNILPARLGEAARVLALARADDVAPANATAAVVFGRVLDLVALILVVCVPSLHFDVASHGRLRTVAVAGSALGVALVALLVVVYRLRETLTVRAARLGPRAARIAEEFAEGFSALSSPARMIEATLASIAAPLTVAACYACALNAFGMSDLPTGSSLVLVATILIAIAIPSAPSSLGVFHAAVTWLLPKLGATPSQAVAFAIVTHAIGVVAFIGVGSISLFVLGAGVLPIHRREKDS